MPRRAIQRILAAVKAWNRRDWDEALKHAGPDFVLDNSSSLGEWRGIHRGERVRQMWEQFVEPWESVQIEIDELTEIRPHELILTRQTTRFVGRDGIELPGPIRSGWLWAFEEGLLIRLAVYTDLDDALEAAALSK